MADVAQQRPTILERAEHFATLIFVRAGVLPWFLIISIVVFSVTTDNFSAAAISCRSRGRRPTW